MLSLQHNDSALEAMEERIDDFAIFRWAIFAGRHLAAADLRVENGAYDRHNPRHEPQFAASAELDPQGVELLLTGALALPSPGFEFGAVQTVRHRLAPPRGQRGISSIATKAATIPGRRAGARGEGVNRCWSAR
jgi:hypothetical protein